MEFFKGRGIIVILLFMGGAKASSPYISEKPNNDYSSLAEDFNGTVFQIRIKDSDDGDTIQVFPSDDKTRQYFTISLDKNDGNNNVLVNVSVTNGLDRETLGSSVPVNLGITDNQGNKILYKFTVYIIDINDNKPVFQALPYNLDIKEKPCNITTVYTEILATDKDNNANGRVTYSMGPKAQSNESRQQYAKAFSMNSNTGHVTLNECLDYETNSYYQFTITAKDSGPNGGLNATAEFIIRVQDVQDKPPFFTGDPYRETIYENILVGKEVVKVNARDGDPGVSNKVNYTIETCTCGPEYFRINKETGSITTLKVIDRDNGTVKNKSGNCIITVLAEEEQKPDETQYGNTTALTNITITVQDVDDNRPSFDSQLYDATVPENTPKDVPLTLNKTITVTDLDQGNNALMKISLLNSDNSSCTDFLASPSEIQGSGKVTILVQNKDLLDYETLNSTTIKVLATEAANSSIFSEATLNINILDRNDNNPEFNSTKFDIEIKENTPNGTIICQINATDADTLPEFKTITYSLSGGSDRFTVDKTTGYIRTSCTNCKDQLDREKRADYYMTFFATDEGGNRNSTEVTVTLADENDNPPIFSRPLYTSFITENENTQIVKLEATDRDKENTNNSHCTFSIVSSSDKGVEANLTINNETGEIRLRTPVDFEALQDSKGIVNVTVEVTDMGNIPLNTTAVVQITVQDENDNEPFFNQTVYKGSVKEDKTSNATFKTNITQVFAKDNDVTEQNKKISYFKTEGSDKFTVDSSTGIVSIRMNSELDRETEPVYKLTIIAIDQGSPPQTGTTTLSIIIIDVNDKKPQFLKHQYIASVTENTTAVGTIIKTCNGTDEDENNSLVYSITKVEAHDENGDLVNKILVEDYFRIHENNGSVYVDGILDRETAKTVTLEIQVNDTNAVLNTPQTDNASLTITLTDINDNFPIFEKSNYLLNVSEDAEDGRSYNGPKATDRDVNRTITYKLINGSIPISSFKIDNSTGTLVKIGDLDREKNSSFGLQVIAIDNGIPSKSSTIDIIVTVLDANDNPPVFSHNSLDNKTKHIKENSANDTVLLDIDATDADEGPNNNNVTYYMEKNDNFGINETTGTIYVTKSPDRELTSQTKLIIIAKDNPIKTKTQKSSSMTITVYIDDENDNSPTFAQNYAQNIEEDKGVGSIIIKVTATDKDQENTNNSDITYMIDDSYDNKFSIDAYSGEIKINSSLTDCVGKYQLTVIAYDEGIPRRNGSAFVNITVTDKNRHPPVIGNLLIKNEIKIYECAKRLTVIHTFNYTDGDHDENAKADFNITVLQDNVTGVFNLTKDGKLIVVGTLDVNAKMSYKFGIMATDHGTPHLSSDVVKITVNLMDVNDHQPSFNSKIDTWRVQENKTHNDSIGKVTAYDKDMDSTLCYSIDGKWADYFTVNNASGNVYSVHELDHELNNTITFIVNVSDCSIPKNISDYCDEDSNDKIDKDAAETISSIEVTIDVTDIDDSPPVFKQKYLATGMRRNTEADTELELHLRNESYISDADTPQNGVFSWVFSNYGNITISPDLKDRVKANSGARPCDDNINHILCVTRNGTIVNNKFFSEDLSGYFILTVKVADNGGFDTADITIYLISDSQVITMTIRNNKGNVALFKDDLLQSLSGILGHTAVFDSLQDHKENGEIDPLRSDLSFHIVDKQSQAVLAGKDAIDLFDEQANNQDMLALQNQYNVQNVAQQSMTKVDTETTSERLTFILLAVSITEAVIISTIIFIAISARKKFRRKLKAAVINTPDMEMHVHEQKEIAIPGSNLYSKQNNPLLNAKISQNMQEADMDSNSYEDVNLDENAIDDPHTVYDKMEEKEVTLDMYTDDTVQNMSSEDLLDAALHQHAMRKSMESLDRVDDDDDNDADDISNTALAFPNEAYTEDFESTEI